MTTPKFTPGPWRHACDSFRSLISTPDAPKVAIAEVFHVEPNSPADNHWLKAGEEGMSNAILIASAPDLYAALERLLETTRAMAREYRIPGSVYGFDTNLAETALAKARGMKGGE